MAAADADERGVPEPSPAALRGDLRSALGEACGVGALAAWRRGWVLSALGRYGEALRELERAAAGGAATAAAAAVTRGAILRQVGLHEHAEAAELAALALRPPGLVVAALAVGLVADGVGRGAGTDELAERLRAAERAVHAAGDERQRVRLGWVRGEVALVAGDAVAAFDDFTRARGRAERLGWRRHVAKSELFRAGAAAARGDADTASALAHIARGLAGVCAAAPLRWPALLVLADAAGLRHEHERASRLRHAAAAELSVRLATLPAELAAHARRRPPAVWLLG